MAKSFARIHRSNLINMGILPLVFKDPADYDKLTEGDTIAMKDLKASVEKGEFILTAGEGAIELVGDFSEREKAMLLEGGYLNYTKNRRA